MHAIKQVILCALLIIPPAVACLGCGFSSDDTASPKQLRFAVVDSLLGPAFQISAARKQFNPPLGFELAPDSVLVMLQAKLSSGLGSQAGVKLVGCFFDTVYNAAVLVSVIDMITLSSDTGEFFGSYRQSLTDASDGDQVREGEYWIGQIQVKNFLVTDSINVRFQLLCLSAQSDAVELVYFASRVYYPRLIRHFESSIGSLKLIKQGG